MDDPRAERVPAGAARFEDQGEIARGGMGLVRALWDGLLGRRVALKELPADSDAATTAAFLDEARIMGGLDHPGIVPVYDLQTGAPGTTPRLLMKLVDGRTLADLLHETPEPPSGLRLERLLGVVLKVCDAVSFAHSRGVVHRDLHPGNVMVGSHGQVYVMDWGLAVRRGHRSAARPPLPGGGFGSGTPAYMAPEQAWGRDDEVDERTDVFGIGALLYEVLTLRSPFAGETFAEVLEAARDGRVVPPEQATAAHEPPARLCEIVVRALATDRADRHPTVDALRDELEAVLRSGGWFPAQRFARGELLLREDDVGDRAYIVTHGTCEVFRTLHGRTEILRVVGPGGVVGEIGLVAGTPRVASVRAVTDVTALVVTREALERELGRSDWMRAFVEAGILRFAELDGLRRTSPDAT